MTRYMTVYDRPTDPRYVLVRGNVRDWLRRSGTPSTWSPPDRGWFVRRERFDELLELADFDHVRVTLRGDR